MEILTDPDMNAASIWLAQSSGTGDALQLDDNVIVTLDGDRLTSIEVLNLDEWGEPFDEAAAHRVLAWVRGRLAGMGRAIAS